MRFGDTPIDEAAGAILGHSWRAGGINFSKGRRLSADDVGKLVTELSIERHEKTLLELALKWRKHPPSAIIL